MLAKELKELVEAYHHPEWVPKYGSIDFDYDEFLKGLTYYTKVESGCFNVEPCKGGCQVPGCSIKPCAKERGVEVCFKCDEFPCRNFSEFLESHPDHAKECDGFKRNRNEWLKTHIQKMDRGYCRATNKYYIGARQNP